jgi:hypothetical protein
MPYPWGLGVRVAGRERVRAQHRDLEQQPWQLWCLWCLWGQRICGPDVQVVYANVHKGQCPIPISQMKLGFKEFMPLVQHYCKWET